MNPKDVSYNWLSSGGAYFLLALVWISSSIFFGFYAARIGRDKNSRNDGCLLIICTTVFVFTGGAVGIFLAPFPWFIFTSTAGAIIAPMLACRIFLKGKMKY